MSRTIAVEAPPLVCTKCGSEVVDVLERDALRKGCPRCEPLTAASPSGVHEVDKVQRRRARRSRRIFSGGDV